MLLKGEEGCGFACEALKLDLKHGASNDDFNGL